MLDHFRAFVDSMHDKLQRLCLLSKLCSSHDPRAMCNAHFISSICTRSCIASFSWSIESHIHVQRVHWVAEPKKLYDQGTYAVMQVCLGLCNAFEMHLTGYNHSHGVWKCQTGSHSYKVEVWYLLTILQAGKEVYTYTTYNQHQMSQC